MARLANRTETIKKLFALSGNYCAFPGCLEHIINNDGQLIGQVCHIEAANEEGERFNPLQTDEERRGFENLILFCANHHLVTNNVLKFSVEYLKEIKREHENKFFEQPYQIPQHYFEPILKKVESDLDKLYAISLDTNQRLKDVQAQLALINDNLLINSKAAEEKIYIAQLDSIKELKKQNKYQTVIDLLDDYRKNNWTHLSSELKYKVIANKAVAYFDLHKTDEAAKILVELQSLNYETDDSIAYLALAFAILKQYSDFDVWFQKAKNLNSKNVNLWLGFVYRHEEEKSIEEIIKEIPEEVSNKAEILFKIGQVLFQSGNKEKGIEFLKKAQTELHGSNEAIIDIKAAIACTLLKDIIAPFKYVFKHFSERELAELEEANKLLSEAWELIKNTELVSSRWYIVMNRGVISKVIGSLDKALSDFQQAYEISKEYIPFVNLVALLIQMSKYELAKELFSNIHFENLSTDETYIIQNFQVRLFSLTGQTSEAIQLLEAGLDTQDINRKQELLILIINVLAENNQFDKSLEYCCKLISDFPDNINGYLFKGYVEYKQGNIEKAISDYDHAQTLISSSTQIHELYQLAQGFVETKSYKKAVTILEKIVDKDLNNDLSRALIYCYYQSGDLSSAISLSKHLFAKYPENPFFAEILINVYQETNNYSDAISVLEQFLPFANSDVKDIFLIKGATLYYYLRDMNNVERMILQINKPNQLSFDDGFKLSYFLIKTGKVENGVDVAYKTRARFYDNSEAHTNYLRALTEADKDYEKEMFPASVKIDSVIILLKDDNTGFKQTFLITTEQDNLEENLNPSDDFAKQLLDKKIGDIVIMDKGYGIEHKFIVSEILNKYVHAYRQSLKLFETRFANSNGIQVLKANPGQPDDETLPFIKGISLTQQEFGKQVIDLYNKGIATVGTISEIFKRNVVKQWFNLIGSSDVFIQAYLHNEEDAVAKFISVNKIVVVDTTFLLAAFFLFPESYLINHLSGQILVAQSTVDELQQYYEELEMHQADGISSMGYQDGHLVIHTIDKENVSQHRQLIKKIIDWCSTVAQITTSKKVLEINRDERKKSTRILGESFFDTVLLAQEHDAIVLSDDAIFKKILESEYKLQSFSTYQFGIYLLQKELINIKQWEEFVVNLILCNYIFIPVTCEVLWKTFEKSAFQIRKPFITAVRGLFIMKLEFLVFHIGKFLRELYLNTGLTSTKEQIVLYIFNEVSQHPQYEQLKKLLRLIIQREFQLLPNFKDDIIALMK